MCSRGPGPRRVLLSIAAELLAFTAVGLIAAWGEVFPGWVAVSRGLGRQVNGSRINGPSVLELHDWQGWLAAVAYAPLLLWGPLLGVATIGYWRRRHHAAR